MGIWLIANNLFAKQDASASFRNIALEDEGKQIFSLRNLMQGAVEGYPVESSKSFCIFCGLVVTVVGIVGGGQR